MTKDLDDRDAKTDPSTPDTPSPTTVAVCMDESKWTQVPYPWYTRRNPFQQQQYPRWRTR